MNRIIRTAAVALVAVSAVALWGCSDDDDSLTLEEYFAQVDAIDNDATERIDAVFNGITDETDVQQFRDAFKEFAPILGEVADDLNDINPPNEVEDEHDALASELEAFADRASEIADGVDDIQASTPEELFAAIDEQGFTEADDAFSAACLDLQAAAAANNITVDLGCEDSEEDGDAPTEETGQTLGAAVTPTAADRCHPTGC